MVNLGIFAQLVPLRSLVPADRAQLAKQSSVLSYGAGQAIFGVGELARTQAYLVAGEIDLIGETDRRVLRVSDPDAQYPLAPGHRRSASAVARSACQILFVDRELVDLLLTWSQTGGVEADSSDKSESIDWMTYLLQSKAFMKIPAANIAQILASMEPVSFFAGNLILKQGDVGDYYYVITEGTVQVVLDDPGAEHEEELAQLGVGRAFGEEALVSGEPRNATVRAVTRCALMRLSGAAFAKLLKAPLLSEISMHEIPAKAQIIDVRIPSEYRHGHLPRAISAPLSRIRELAKTLDPKLSYVVYCDTGRRSASATYLLSERGFDATMIRSGVPPHELRAIEPPLAA